MRELDEYLKWQQKVYDYFGFTQDWVVYPIDDRRNMYWFIRSEDEVLFCENRADVEGETGNHYGNEIYHQRFYSKWIHRGEAYTMIMVDTHTDGNKFLAIYDNAKELIDHPNRDPEL